MKKIKFIAMAVILAMACSAVPSYAAESDVLMVCDFEDGETLDVTSSGTASFEVVDSPMGSGLEQLTADEYGDITKADGGENPHILPDGGNHVLKLSQPAAGDTNTIKVYEGILPDNFAIDFTAMQIDGNPSYTISVIQGDTSLELIKCSTIDQILAGTVNGAGHRAFKNSVWMPNTLVFKNFYSDNASVKQYYEGMIKGEDYQAGAYYSGLNPSESVQIVITSAGAQNEVYFDNIRLYKYSDEISYEAGNDFESETVRMQPVQNGIITGGNITRQGISGGGAYGIIRYKTSVEKDPVNSSNKVLKGIRGRGGSNPGDYDPAVRFTVKKPTEKLTVKFKVWQSENFQLDVDVANGAFPNTFSDLYNSTDKDQIFRILSNKQLVSFGSYPVFDIFTNAGWELNAWNDVELVYYVAENKTDITINGNKFTAQHKDTNTFLANLKNDMETPLTVSLYAGTMSSGQYNLYDDISIISDDGNIEEPTPPEPEETQITATKPQPLLSDGENAGLFWNVNVTPLNADYINAVFTDGEKTINKTLDLSKLSGGGSVDFSVLLKGAPENVMAEFTAAE